MHVDVGDHDLLARLCERFGMPERSLNVLAEAVKIACDLVSEKLIDEKTAVKRVPANDLTGLLAKEIAEAGNMRNVQ